MTTSTSLRLEVREYDDPLVTGLIDVLQQDFVVRYGGPDAAVVDPAQFRPPEGLFLVGFDEDGTAVAMGGYRVLPAGSSPTGPGTAEIKRMWVHPDARGRGYARAVLARLEAEAAAAGLRTLVLNTGPQQPEAIALYLSSGYTPVPPFGHYAATRGALFYGRALSSLDDR